MEIGASAAICLGVLAAARHVRRSWATWQYHNTCRTAPLRLTCGNASSPLMRYTISRPASTRSPAGSAACLRPLRAITASRSPVGRCALLLRTALLCQAPASAASILPLQFCTDNSPAGWSRPMAAAAALPTLAPQAFASGTLTQAVAGRKDAEFLQRVRAAAHARTSQQLFSNLSVAPLRSRCSMPSNWMVPR